MKRFFIMELVETVRHEVPIAVDTDCQEDIADRVTVENARLQAYFGPEVDVHSLEVDCVYEETGIDLQLRRFLHEADYLPGVLDTEEE